MNRRRRVMYQWAIFVGLLVGFGLFLWFWFHTEPPGPRDFSE